MTPPAAPRARWPLGAVVAAGCAGVAVAALRLGRYLPGSVRAGTDLGRGLALRGTVWAGGSAEPFDGTVVVAADGTVAEVAPAGALRLPADLPVLGGEAGSWIGPGVIDAHVHLALSSPAEALTGGVVAVRDLGAPPAAARAWRDAGGPGSGPPAVAAAGPIVTAPGGYPSRSWGADGFAVFADSPETARAVVRDLAADGVDLVKVALEPGAGWPVPTPAALRALVEAAHAAGLRVTAHALATDMVRRALDARVDELCHTPTERLTEDLVERVAAAGLPVVSTLQTFFSAGRGTDAARNAADLVRAGVPLVYGTDLGNTGTRPGVDARELDRIADTGLGRLGALRAATEGAATAYGLRGHTGLIRVGAPAAVVLLAADPLVEPGAWHVPVAVVAGGQVLRR